MTVTITRPVRRRPQFHALAVAAIERLADDAVAVPFHVPPDLPGAYAISAGQHLTVRRFVDGEDMRRSYSICSTPADLAEHGRLSIGVKHVAGGSFSEYVVSELASGATVDVMPPLGHFTTAFAADRSR